MEMTMHLSRTAKGQEEIFNHGHTLRPKQRQILFSLGNGISFAELRSKLPNCAELESMVNDLLQSGFIQALRDMAAGAGKPVVAPAAPAAPVLAAPDLAEPILADPIWVEPVLAAPMNNALADCRSYVLDYMSALVGTKSPAYRQMSETQDIDAFNAVLPMCRRVVAAVASPHQAVEMGAEVDRRLGR